MKKIETTLYAFHTTLLLILAFFSLTQPLLLIAIGLLALSAFATYQYVRKVKEKINYFEQIIDSISHPLSVTDMDMKWTFVNKAATEPLGVTRESVLGQSCHNWGANICQTEDCGVACLRKGQPVTAFSQWGKDFKVETSFLTGLNGENIGHIEVVQDISEKTALERVYHELVELSTHLNSGSQGLNQASESLAQGATQQAAAVTEISVSLESTVSDASQNAQRATTANGLVSNVSQTAHAAAEDMREFEATMTEITHASEEIQGIIKVIDDIASQTNLLALNASIEAARAGEVGRGFAVVADEVRQLAERSAEAAQQSTQHLQKSLSSVEKGSQISLRCVHSLQQVEAQLTQIIDTVDQIDQSSNQQAIHLDQIQQSVAEIDEVVHATASSAEETQGSAQEFNLLATQLEAQLKSIRNIEGLIVDIKPRHKEIKIAQLD